jgi:glycosyltransferase involved in cell wall biosynthesis
MLKKIRILRILNRFNVGGPVYNATYLTKYLNSDFYETLLIGGKPENHEQSAEYILNGLDVSFKQLKFMRRAISPLFDLISLIQIIIIIYKFKPHIIHTHAAKSGLLGRLASMLYYKKVRLVHTYHGNVFEGYFSNFKNNILIFIERFLAKKSTKIIAISKLQSHDLIYKYKICEKEKIEIVPLGFDLNRFTEDKNLKREKLRKEFNVHDDTILITIIGRIVPVKNHQLFIDVINYCKNRSSRVIKALIVGDGSETEKIINCVENYNLSYSYKDLNKECDVLFSSWRSDIDSVLAASDIVCLTSLNEGTPVSIIESMASETASISTNVGGVSDIIENNISGIVSSKKVNDYGENLLQIIEDDKLRLKLAKKGKSISLENYNYNKLVFNIESLYQKII